MWKDSLFHFHAGYINMECLQGSYSVPSLFFPCLYRWVWLSTIVSILLSSSLYFLGVRVRHFETSRYFLINHNKLNFSSARVSMLGAGCRWNRQPLILYLVGLQSSVYISWRVVFPLHVECGWSFSCTGTVLCGTVESEFRSPLQMNKEVDRTLS